MVVPSFGAVAMSRHSDIGLPRGLRFADDIVGELVKNLGVNPALRNHSIARGVMARNDDGHALLVRLERNGKIFDPNFVRAQSLLRGMRGAASAR